MVENSIVKSPSAISYFKNTSVFTVNGIALSSLQEMGLLEPNETYSDCSSYTARDFPVECEHP
jgi:hypothetical protein